MTFQQSVCVTEGIIDFVGSAKRLTIRTRNNPRVSLVAAVIGSDFVAGISEDSGLWWGTRLTEVISLTTSGHREPLPDVRIHNGDLLELLSKLPVPLRMQVHQKTVVVREFNGAWALLAGVDGAVIPVAGIGEFALVEAPDQAMSEVAA